MKELENLIDREMKKIIKKLEQWIEFRKKQNDYMANLLEDDSYNLVALPIIRNLIKIISETCLESEYYYLMNRLSAWEQEINLIWLDFYEECAIRELDEYENYSIIDGMYDAGIDIKAGDKPLESNFLRWIFKGEMFNILVSPVIEYKGKVLFMPITYIKSKLENEFFEIPKEIKEFEQIAEWIIIEEEIHAVLTRNLSEQVSKQFDNQLSKKRKPISALVLEWLGR